MTWGHVGALALVLVRGARRIRLPARVAPGTWNLSVRFPGTSASMDRGSVDVRAGLNVRCEADFMRCGG